MSTSASAAQSKTQRVETVTIRFVGDSGDGMQLTGSEFTKASALAGNDLATFPDYPAEIRAPAGSLAGVSGYQVNFGSREIHTPGDAPDVLVAMNPAALKTNLADLKTGGMLIVNSGAFNESNLEKAGYKSNPLDDEALKSNYRIFRVDMNKLTAAHRTLPFGTRVRVTFLENGKSVVVRINDRFPNHKGRVIDLSRGAARAIGLIGPGTGRVRLEVVGP